MCAMVPWRWRKACQAMSVGMRVAEWHTAEGVSQRVWQAVLSAVLGWRLVACMADMRGPVLDCAYPFSVCGRSQPVEPNLQCPLGSYLW